MAADESACVPSRVNDQLLDAADVGDHGIVTGVRKHPGKVLDNLGHGSAKDNDVGIGHRNFDIRREAVDGTGVPGRCQPIRISSNPDYCVTSALAPQGHAQGAPEQANSIDRHGTKRHS
jgi:hypothetical protein